MRDQTVSNAKILKARKIKENGFVVTWVVFNKLPRHLWSDIIDYCRGTSLYEHLSRSESNRNSLSLRSIEGIDLDVLEDLIRDFSYINIRIKISYDDKDSTSLDTVHNFMKVMAKYKNVSLMHDTVSVSLAENTLDLKVTEGLVADLKDLLDQSSSSFVTKS